MNDNYFDKATIDLHYSEGKTRKYTKLTLDLNVGDIRLIKMNNGKYKVMLEAPCDVQEDQRYFYGRQQEAVHDI